MEAKPAPKIPFLITSEALAGLIYGVVTAMAVIAALADKSANVIYMSGAAIATSLALALTYVFAHWLSGSYSNAPHGGGRVAWRFELPTLLGPVALSIVMVLEKAAGMSTVAAAESTMWVGTVALFVLGFRIARYGGRGIKQSLGFGLMDSAIGASLVLGKVLVH